MQTFLPYPDFARSAAALDRQRLGKQRVECLQLMRAILGGASGWSNHPATRMWAEHPAALVAYGLAVCAEWTSRGYRDSCAEKLTTMAQEAGLGVEGAQIPPWLGREDLHASHRSNLLRKAPEHYAQFGWAEPPSIPYVWPVEKGSSS